MLNIKTKKMWVIGCPWQRSRNANVALRGGSVGRAKKIERVNLAYNAFNPLEFIQSHVLLSIKNAMFDFSKGGKAIGQAEAA
jgi:hypothetical protein